MEFEAQENALIVSGILDDPNDTEFEVRGVEALNAADGELLIDLTGVDYVGTWHLGRLTLIAMKADAQGKRLRVRAEQKVIKVIRMVGLDQILTAEQAG